MPRGLNRFKDKDAERLFLGLPVRGFPPDLRRRARMRLQRVVAAASLGDLAVPPSHRLERLRGSRADQLSIRVNDQWRVCFRWTPEGAAEIEIADYHR